MATSGVSSTASSTSTKIKYEKSEDRATLSRDDFMKLFVTQLQYQDPSNPMESAEMASQMAQFNMVDLMQKNNEAMEKLVEHDASRLRLDSVSFIGRQVEYKGSNVKITEEDGARPFKVKLESDAASMSITIKDSSNNIVRTLEPGATVSGYNRIDWDGKDDMGNTLPAGKYSIFAAAKDASGEDVETSIWTIGSVSGVDLQETDEIKLVLDDGTEVAFTEINAIS